MCGIVGYIGDKNAYEIVINGLKRLEYRGYDSSGIALFNSKLSVCKTKGKVERFNRYLKESFITPLAATMAQAGLRFNVAVANAHIGPWLMQVADQRIHGTTGQKPSVLLDQERHEFLPLPLQSVACATPMDAMSPMPFESFQHPLSTYDRLLEPRL